MADLIRVPGAFLAPALFVGLLSSLAVPATQSPASGVVHVVRAPGASGERPTARIMTGSSSIVVPQPVGSAPAAGLCDLLNGGFHNGLYGWDVQISPGGPPDGSITIAAGRARFEEGASALTTLRQTICIPPGATELRFDLSSVAFDASGTFVPDAFEVSLLDASFQPVVPSWSPFASSFFNVQEDGTTYLGPDAQLNGSLVALDLTGVSTGITVDVYFDLIGADSDTASTVEIDDVVLDAGQIGFEFCAGIDCPCGNDFPDGGCANSSGLGAILGASGSTSVTADDLVLTIENVGPSYALIIGGQQSICTQLGDGFLATGPGPFQSGLLRFLAAQPGPGGTIQLGPGIIDFAETQLGAGGLLIAGSTWTFTAVYRDGPVSPCGNLFNLSNGVAVTFSN